MTENACCVLGISAIFLWAARANKQHSAWSALPQGQHNPGMLGACTAASSSGCRAGIACQLAGAAAAAVHESMPLLSRSGHVCSARQASPSVPLQTKKPNASRTGPPAKDDRCKERREAATCEMEAALTNKALPDCNRNLESPCKREPRPARVPHALPVKCSLP